MHYIKLDNFSLTSYHYCYLDASDHLCDQIFIKHHVKVNFERREMQHPSRNYVIVFCRIRKKDKPGFLEALEELPKKMLLLGRDDYSIACEDFKRALTPRGED